MRPGGLTIISGGEPTPDQIGALAAALTAVLEEGRAPAPGPVPAAYRSRWRRAAVAEAVAPCPPWDGRA